MVDLLEVREYIYLALSNQKCYTFNAKILEKLLRIIKINV